MDSIDIEGGGEEVFSKTTSLMGAGDKELVEFNFNGEFGQNYILKFADNGSDHHRGAIDNLKFGQLGKHDMFTLDTNGILKTATTFDYESNASTYTITVQAKDELNATTEGNFTVTLFDANDPANGTVIVTGTPAVGRTLSVSNTLADEDGLGVISCQWYREGKAIMYGGTFKDGVNGIDGLASRVRQRTK